MTETRTLIDAAAAVVPKTEWAWLEQERGLMMLSRPGTHHHEIMDLERFLQRPRRVQREVSLDTYADLCNYVDRFKSPSTVVAVSRAAMKVKAFIEYIEPDPLDEDAVPSFCDFIATHRLDFSTDFKPWLEIHGKELTQAQFASFLEDNAEIAVSPEPADLMEVASKFETNRSVGFQSVVNLSTGEREFKYQEKDHAVGAIRAPKVIYMGCPILVATLPVEWSVRFAYRINDGALRFTATIHRLDALIDRAVAEIASEIDKQMKPLKIPVYLGAI